MPSCLSGYRCSNLRDSCKKSSWDGSSSLPSPPTRSSWSTLLCIVTAARQSSSITSGILFLNHFSLPPTHHAYNGRCSFLWIGYNQWHALTSSQGPEVAPFLLLRYAMPCFLDSPQVPCIARAIIELAINARRSCLIRARRLQSNLSSLRCARAAAVRVNANEPTNLETAKALWA